MLMGSHSVSLPKEITCRKSGVATTRTWNLQITSRELYQLGQHVTGRVAAVRLRLDWSNSRRHAGTRCTGALFADGRVAVAIGHR